MVANGHMIEDDEIARFPAEKQAEIRKAIERMENNGRERRFLRLMRDGSVLYDRAAEEDFLDYERFGNQ